MAARGILMGIAPIEKCLRVAQAQVAPIVYGRREWGYTYTRWGPVLFYCTN